MISWMLPSWSTTLSTAIREIVTLASLADPAEPPAQRELRTPLFPLLWRRAAGYLERFDPNGAFAFEVRRPLVRSLPIAAATVVLLAAVALALVRPPSARAYAGRTNSAPPPSSLQARPVSADKDAAAKYCRGQALENTRPSTAGETRPLAEAMSECEGTSNKDPRPTVRRKRVRQRQWERQGQFRESIRTNNGRRPGERQRPEQKSGQGQGQARAKAKSQRRQKQGTEEPSCVRICPRLRHKSKRGGTKTTSPEAGPGRQRQRAQARHQSQSKMAARYSPTRWPRETCPVRPEAPPGDLLLAGRSRGRNERAAMATPISENFRVPKISRASISPAQGPRRNSRRALRLFRLPTEVFPPAAAIWSPTPTGPTASVRTRDVPSNPRRLGRHAPGTSSLCRDAIAI